MEIVDSMQVIPDDFLKVGCESLGHITNLSFRPNSAFLSSQGVGMGDDGGEELTIPANFGCQPMQPIQLRPITDGTPVFGVDTSSIELGETDNGILCAVRGVVVLREGKTYRYVRHGPFVFHTTEENKQTLFNLLRRVYLKASGKVRAPGVEWMADSVRSILERWLQRQVCESCEDALLLWDGSLTAITAYGPVSFMSEVLRLARDRGNHILAFSKKTMLSVSGRKVVDLVEDRYAPCLVSIDDAVRKDYGNRLCFFGRVYAAKLTPGCFTFRMDFDRHIPEEDGITAVQRLIGNDLLVDSYPETLRLAHILARFSASEVIGMQRYVAENYGLRVVLRPDVRQALFGLYAGFS